MAQGLPEALAHRISSCDPLHSALDLVEISKASRLPIVFAATAYFDIRERIGLDWLKQQIEALEGGGHWHAVAHAALLDNLYELQRRITGAALRCQGRTATLRVNAWLAARPAAITSLNGLLTDLRGGPPPDFATLSVALESVRHLPGADT